MKLCQGYCINTVSYEPELTKFPALAAAGEGHASVYLFAKRDRSDLEHTSAASSSSVCSSWPPIKASRRCVSSEAMMAVRCKSRWARKGDLRVALAA